MGDFPLDMLHHTPERRDVRAGADHEQIFFDGC